MDNFTPKVTLISWTASPLQTVYSVWEASKGEDRLRTPAEIKQQVDPAEVEELFRAVIAQEIPVGEHVDLVYMLENISVSWREQAVRHRIGVNPSPERLGADMVMIDKIPDLANSSFWSQSMRIQNVGEFASKRQYRMPDTIKNHPKRQQLEEIYRGTMETVATSYRILVDAGIPMEDARELIPLGAQHRMSWKLNISALQHIVGKRGCWILQLGIWGPIIKGMIEEAATKIHPIFREMVTPPCIKNNKFNECVFMEECRRRLDGSDKLPPCPLHLNYHTDELKGDAAAVPMFDEMDERAEQYRDFWGRDPYTGERL